MRERETLYVISTALKSKPMFYILEASELFIQSTGFVSRVKFNSWLDVYVKGMSHLYL